jgi:hypothetical protein
MHGGMMASMGLWMRVWGLFALAVLVLAVLGIVAPVRHLSTHTTPGGRTWRQPDDTTRPAPPDRAPP